MILSDSVVKDLNGWDLSQKAKKFKFNLLSFSCAKADFFNDYFKLAFEEKLDHFIIHTRTNCVTNNGKSPKALVNSIIKLENSLKDDSNYGSNI